MKTILTYLSIETAPPQPVTPFDTEFPTLTDATTTAINSPIWNNTQIAEHNVRSHANVTTTDKLERLKTLVPRRSNLIKAPARPQHQHQAEAKIRRLDPPTHTPKDNHSAVTMQDQQRFYLFLKRWTGGTAASNSSGLYKEKAVGGGDWWKQAHPRWPRRF
ncbi:hypothetical protein [Absidia glauca]|uniref:Uncharacterized protein n=1 Tax=Absidia glauca TaxID=4829 RepID=A0A168PLC6_ABSGL|nr:hypothetical protein [Absidia glauca]